MSASPFDPDLRRIAAFLPRRVALGPRSLWVIRQLTRLASPRSQDDVDVQQVGAVAMRVHRPPAGEPAQRPALLWIHGGGYVLGTAAGDDDLCRRFARELGIVVAAVDYRLAPEHPFPAALHDCHDALVWLAGQADVDADRVAIGGTSAGGGLAAALALLARERDEVRPVFQLLAHPGLDDRTVLRTDIDERYIRAWSNGSNRFAWTSYLGQEPGSANVSGLAAPARHDDLTGLPPAWIGVGRLDLLLDEGVAYAERLRAAGVDCALEIFEGAFHGFDALRPRAGISERFRRSQIDALAGVLLGDPAPESGS